MRKPWVAYLGAAMLAGAGGTLPGPAPVGAAAREIVELQQSMDQLIRGQKDIQTTLVQSTAVDKTLMEQSVDTVNKLTGTKMALQKTVQDMQANSGARLDSMATQVQGISDNLQETLARMGKLNQQLTDAHNAIEGIDLKLSSNGPPPTLAGSTPVAVAPPGGLSAIPGTPARAASIPPGAVPSADLLYSDGVRDVNGKK